MNPRTLTIPGQTTLGGGSFEAPGATLYLRTSPNAVNWFYCGSIALPQDLDRTRPCSVYLRAQPSASYTPSYEVDLTLSTELWVDGLVTSVTNFPYLWSTPSPWTISTVQRVLIDPTGNGYTFPDHHFPVGRVVLACLLTRIGTSVDDTYPSFVRIPLGLEFTYSPVCQIPQ